MQLVIAGGASLTIGNTLLAGNHDLSGEAPDCALNSLSVTNNGYNLLSNGAGCGWPVGISSRS